MTREQFIEEIEKRGLKHKPYSTDTLPRWDREFNGDLCISNISEDVASLMNVKQKTPCFFHFPYSAITVEVITAVAGKEQNDAN